MSLASGRAAYSRLQATAGRVTPARVARLSEARLRNAGLTRQKASYCRHLARCIVDRTLTLGHLAQLDDHAGRSTLLKVPGVISVARFKTEELTMIIGGERKTIVMENQPKYTALYELESADVLVSEGWANAVDAGRWPGEVRPFTSNRRHVLSKLVGP